MLKLLPFLACMMLIISTLMGTAHAAEVVGCAEMSQTMQMHDTCDGNHVPADADNGSPHHHASCHGHHIGTPIAVGMSARPIAHDQAYPAMRGLALTSDAADQRLRPPQA